MYLTSSTKEEDVIMINWIKRECARNESAYRAAGMELEAQMASFEMVKLRAVIVFSIMGGCYGALYVKSLV